MGRGALAPLILLALFALPVLAPAAAAGTPAALAAADERLAVASRFLEGGIYDQPVEIALSILNDPAFRQPDNATGAETEEWLARREAARFILERGRFGMAKTEDEFLDVADEFAFLFQNRYRLDNPAYNLQSAYWAGRAYQAAEAYGRAVAMYARVGGFNLPPNMEGDAARRMSECLRLQAEQLPFPGTGADRQLRSRLLDQAISELDRARNAFPVGRERKELELDLIALRLARREPDFVREALAEADAFLANEAARDELRARAALYRGMAAERLGDVEDAIKWFRSAVSEENPAPGDRREAQIGLALALREASENQDGDARKKYLAEAVEAFRAALDGVEADEKWDQARIVMAMTLLDLGRFSVALDTVLPIVQRGDAPLTAYYMAGKAELARGRPDNALPFLYAATRPSGGQTWLRLAASREAATAARARGDHGFALAMIHQASRLLRTDRVYSSLLESEFAAMEAILRLGVASGPMSLSSDEELLRGGDSADVQSIENRRKRALEDLAAALGGLFRSGAGADAAYDVAIRAEAAQAWADAGLGDIEIALGLLGHLRNRRPAGVSESVLLSREGEANFALALARARAILAAEEPDEAEIGRVIDNFTRAAASYRAASAGGLSRSDALDQGVVNLASGAVLMSLSEKWARGRWSARAGDWRREALQRIEGSLKPIEAALSRSGPGAPAAMRARWAKAQALEYLQEWRAAAAGYLWFMNNSEAPRLLRINAARHWAECQSKLGENAQALARLEAFAAVDGEAAFLAGQLAEAAGDAILAYRYYRFAADPASPMPPPETPGRRQEAAYKAAKLALDRTAEVEPGADPAKVRETARALLEKAARDDLSGLWTINMLQELGRSWLEDKPDGWRKAHRLAIQAAEVPTATPGLRRAMHLLAAEALRAGGNPAGALDELDLAREILDGADSAAKRADAAAITLATADIYRDQGRYDDALRAYADVFATYPDVETAAEAARLAAARMLLARPDAGAREREQARAILSGVKDRNLAEEILGGK